MKKLLIICAILNTGYVFASSAVAQAAESAAMTKCLQNKSQLECNAMNTAGKKEVQKIQSQQQAQ